MKYNKITYVLLTCLLFALILPAAALAVAPMDELSGLEVKGYVPTLDDGSVAGGPAGALAGSAEWQKFETSTNQGWRVVWDTDTGLPHLAVPAGYDAAVATGEIPSGLTDRNARAATLDAAAIDRISRKVYETLRTSYPALPPGSDLTYLAIEKRADVWWAIYGQNAGETRIDGARADFRYSRDGKLLYLGVDLVPSGAPAPAAVLDGPAAERAAQDALARAGLPAAALHPAGNVQLPSRPSQDRDAWVAATPAAGTSLVYVPVAVAGRLTTRPAWIVRTEVTDPAARFVSWIDAVTGEVLKRENEVRYATISGQSDGDFQLAEPTDPYVTRNFPNLRVTVAGVGDAFTDADGNYSITTPDGSPRQVSSGLTGHFGAIVDALNTPPLIQGTATPGTPFAIHWADGNSDAAERDSYLAVNQEHAYIKRIDPGFTGTDYEMPINVNLNQTCNAYWDGYAVNFFRAGGGCANTGQIPDVVYHEYGHGVSQYVYAPASPSGSEHEGFSDFIAATMTDQPLIGRGFTGPGTWLRTCDNDRQWPAPECGGEVHCEGEVIAGALWHMRQNLVARLGHANGVAVADTLFHYARYGRQPTYEGYYFDVLAVDDDNGTLIDGTPHAAQIIQAFHRHNIGPGWTLDILHTPLHDTESSNPYPVVAVFSSAANLQADSLSVYYTTTPTAGGPSSGPYRLAMSPTGNLREYQTAIPGQPTGTRVDYFIKAAADTLGLTAVDPPGAPATQHEFLVQVDSTPPSITHEPLDDKSAAAWPSQVQATVTDNQAVGSVQVEWKRNNIAQTTFNLTRVGTTDLYQGVFNGTVNEGDHLQYRIKATDTAASPNVVYSPGLGYYTFNIIHDYADDMERGIQDWTHGSTVTGFLDQWHIDTYRSHSASHAWKFGGNGAAHYADGAEGALVTAPILIGPQASLSFWHWMSAETGSSTTAWDGGVAEISTNGGTSWSELIPQGGYPYTIISNPASPFPPGYPCWSGSVNWAQVHIDLAAYNGQTVQVRLRFGSDGAANFEGWYIDDFDLNPGLTSASISENAGLPSRSLFLGNSPNPFRPSTTLSFAVASGDQQVRLDILDVTGRRVRTLLNGTITAGTHTMIWDGRSEDGHVLGSGIYFARLRAGKTESGGKLILMK